MAEQHDLTTPIPAVGGTSFWRVQHITLHYDGDDSYIKIGLVGENSERKSVGYTGDEAAVLIRQLNTANLSVNSLHKRVMGKITTDGLIGAGSVSGTPD